MPLPDYSGGSIANLMSSLVAGLGGHPGVCVPCASLGPAEVAGHRNVVLLVIDGLGDNYLRAAPAARWLNGHRRDRLTSVFPSTTATAITTFLTGEPPSRHGITGWHMYFRELGSVLAVLPGRPRYGGATLGEAGVPVAGFFGHEAVFDRLRVPAHVLSPAHIALSDFNRAHTGRAVVRPFQGLPSMLEMVMELVQHSGGRRFVYGYWPNLDALGHEEGMGSVAAADHLAGIDGALALLAENLAGSDTLLVVTADHGQIDTTDADRILMDEYPDLARMLAVPLCGESRAAYCYVRPRRARDFERCVADQLSHVADLYPAGDLVSMGWFGPGEPHPRLLERIGDYVLVMKEHCVIKDWLPHERRYTLTGVHGGTTGDEMYVPLVVATG